MLERWKQRRTNALRLRETRKVQALIWHLHNLSAAEIARMLVLTHQVADLVYRDCGVDLWRTRHVLELWPDYPDKLVLNETDFHAGTRVNSSHSVQIWKYTYLGLKDQHFFHLACQVWNQLGRGVAGMRSAQADFYVVDPSRIPDGLMVNWG